MVSAVVDLYGITLLKSRRSLSSALMENAGYSGSYASRDRVHSCRHAHVVGDREQQPASRIGWRRVRDDRRWTASLVPSLQIRQVADTSSKADLLVIIPNRFTSFHR